MHKFEHFSLKFDYSLFSMSKTEKTLVKPCKAAKPVPPRAASYRTHIIIQKVQSNAAIAANYGNKRAKYSIIIKIADNNIEKPIRKRKPPLEPRLLSFLINATTYLGKEQ